MADPLRVAVVYGSARPQRLGIRMARFVAGGFARRGHRADLVEPLAHPLPLLELRYREHPEGEAPEALEKVHRIFEVADAFVAVSGEYNGGVPPAMLNILDHFLPEFARKPSAVCCYSVSPFGGARAVAPLRAVFATLGAPPVQAVLARPPDRRGLRRGRGRPSTPRWGSGSTGSPPRSSGTPGRSAGRGTRAPADPDHPPWLRHAGGRGRRGTPMPARDRIRPIRQPRTLRGGALRRSFPTRPESAPNSTPFFLPPHAQDALNQYNQLLRAGERPYRKPALARVAGWRP